MAASRWAARSGAGPAGSSSAPAPATSGPAASLPVLTRLRPFEAFHAAKLKETFDEDITALASIGDRLFVGTAASDLFSLSVETLPAGEERAVIDATFDRDSRACLSTKRARPPIQQLEAIASLGIVAALCDGELCFRDADSVARSKPATVLKRVDRFCVDQATPRADGSVLLCVAIAKKLTLYRLQRDSLSVTQTLTPAGDPRSMELLGRSVFIAYTRPAREYNAIIHQMLPTERRDVEDLPCAPPDRAAPLIAIMPRREALLLTDPSGHTPLGQYITEDREPGHRTMLAWHVPPTAVLFCFPYIVSLAVGGREAFAQIHRHADSAYVQSIPLGHSATAACDGAAAQRATLDGSNTVFVACGRHILAVRPVAFATQITRLLAIGHHVAAEEIARLVFRDDPAVGAVASSSAPAVTTPAAVSSARSRGRRTPGWGAAARSGVGRRGDEDDDDDDDDDDDADEQDEEEDGADAEDESEDGAQSARGGPTVTEVGFVPGEDRDGLRGAPYDGRSLSRRLRRFHLYAGRVLLLRLEFRAAIRHLCLSPLDPRELLSLCKDTLHRRDFDFTPHYLPASLTTGIVEGRVSPGDAASETVDGADVRTGLAARPSLADLIQAIRKHAREHGERLRRLRREADALTAASVGSSGGLAGAAAGTAMAMMSKMFTAGGEASAATPAALEDSTPGGASGSGAGMGGIGGEDAPLGLVQDDVWGSGGEEAVASALATTTTTVAPPAATRRGASGSGPVAAPPPESRVAEELLWMALNTVCDVLLQRRRCSEPSWETPQARVDLDTGLCRALAITKRVNALNAFLRTPNDVDLADAQHFLDAQSLHHSLALLLESRGIRREALEIWRKIGRGVLSTRSGPEVAVESTVRVLQRSDDVDLICTFAEWVLQRHQDRGMAIFCEERSLALPHDRILEYLDQERLFPRASRHLRRRYLTHLVDSLGSRDARFHTELALSLAEAVLELRGETGEGGADQSLSTAASGPSLARASSASASLASTSATSAAARAVDSLVARRGPATDRPEPGTEPGPLGEARRRLLRFLQSSLFYDARQVLARVDRSGLFEERLVLYGRLRDHEAALRMCVFDLGDVPRAEQYCRQVLRDEGGSDRGADRNPFVVLSRVLFGAAAAADAEAARTEIDSSSSAGRPSPLALHYRMTALRLLERHSSLLPAPVALEQLPSQLSVADCRPLLQQLVPSAAARARRAFVRRELTDLDRLDANTELVRVQRMHAVLRRDTKCAVTGKPIGGSVFVLRAPESVGKRGAPAVLSDSLKPALYDPDREDFA